MRRQLDEVAAVISETERDFLDASFSLGQAAIGEGARARAVLETLQNAWGLPNARLRKAGSDDDGPTMPGDHGIPEIGRSERAFYDALTEGQKEAYRTIAALVETLHRQGRGWAEVDPFAFDEPIDEWKRKAFLALATRPMQAYMLGQMLTQEALGAGIARPLYPTDREAIKYLEHQTFTEVGAAFDRFKADLKTTLITGMQAGENPLEMARQLARTFDDYTTDFALLTITENTRAEAAGRLNELKDAGVEYAIGSSAHDTKCCDFCRENIDGVKVKVADVIGKSNYGRKKADWLSVIPAHPRCRCLWLPFTPETAVIISTQKDDVVV